MRDKGASVRWRTARPKLHIDDGCMGGGGAIDYEDKIFFNEKKTGSSYSSFYDIKWGSGWDTDGDFEIDPGEDITKGHFNHNRRNIFHYCLFVDKLYLHRSGSWVTDRAGTSNGPNNNENNKWGGDDFVVTSIASKPQNTFMHELGHNLGLAHPNKPSPKNPNCFHTSHSNLKDTVMYSPSSSANRLDYFNDEWSFIELKYVIDTHYNN